MEKSSLQALSIRRSLIMILMVTLIVFLVFDRGFQVLFQEPARIEQREIATAQGLMDTLHQSFSSDLMHGHLVEMEQMIAFQTTNPRVGALALLDGEGIVLAATDLNWLEQPAFSVIPGFDAQDYRKARYSGEPQLRVVAAEDSIFFYSPILMPALPSMPTIGQSGMLFFRYDMAGARQAAWEILTAWDNWLRWSLSALAIWLLLYWVLERWIRKPIVALTRNIRVFAAYGHLSDMEETPKGQGELAEMIDAFQQMARSVRDATLALENSKAIFQAVFDNSQVGIMMVSGERMFLMGNQRLADILGYASTAEMCGFSMRRLHLSEERYQIFGEKYFQPLAHNRRLHIQYQLKRKDGSPVWCQLSGKAIDDHDPADLHQGVIWVLDDITDRMESERSLRESETRYRSLFDGMSNGVLVCERVVEEDYFRIKEVNPAAEKIIRLSGGQILGTRLCAVLPGADQMGLLEVLLRVAQTGRSENLPLSRYRDEEVDLWLEGYVYRLPNADLVVVFNDVTSRVQALEDLHIKDRALASVVNGVVITEGHRDYKVVYVNKAFQDITGYSEQDVIGRNLRFLHGDDAQQSGLRVIRECLRRGSSCTQIIRNFRSDGTPFLNRLNISPVYSDRGEVTHFLGVQEDVTERMRLDRELAQAHKMEAVGQLTGGIAHDFNNMLATVLGFSQLAKSRLGDVSSEKLAEYLDRVILASERGRDLVAQMMAFARSSAQDDEMVHIDPAPVLKEMAELMHSLLPSSIELTLKLQPALPRIAINGVQLHQVLMNLCVNARDAMDGKGQLVIDAHVMECKGAECSACHRGISGPKLVISVSDTGVGIDDEVLKRMFDPFFTTKSVGKGTGMGLSVVHGIMESSGGHILVNSRPGQGSRFDLLFEISSEDRQGDTELGHEGGTTTVASLRGRQLLLVEDEAAVRSFLTELLEETGCRVVAEENGLLAWERFAAQPDAFDLVLTDETMPKMTGTELVGRIRQQGWDGPIVMLTGNSEVVADDLVSQFQIAHLLTKPVKNEKLLVLLGGLLGGN